MEFHTLHISPSINGLGKNFNVFFLIFEVIEERGFAGSDIPLD